MNILTLQESEINKSRGLEWVISLHEKYSEKILWILQLWEVNNLNQKIFHRDLRNKMGNRYDEVAANNIENIRRKWVDEGKIICDENGRFLYAKAPNGNISNLWEIEWCMVRSENFIEHFWNWEELGKHMISEWFHGWQIRTNYDELLNEFENDFKKYFSNRDPNDVMKNTKDYLQFKFQISPQDFYGNEYMEWMTELMDWILSPKEFIKKIADYKKLPLKIVYPTENVFEILKKFPNVTKDLDANGEPRLEFHGWSPDIKKLGVFDRDKEKFFGWAKNPLYFFTPEKDAAKAYAHAYIKSSRTKLKDNKLLKDKHLFERYDKMFGEAYITHWFLNIKNPQFFTWWHDSMNKDYSFHGEIDEGYDGFIMNKTASDNSIFNWLVDIDFDWYAQSWCVLPNQIKSPYNFSFNKKSNNIYE